MTALGTLTFGEFTLRPAGAKLDDIRLAQNWTAQDKDHAGLVIPTFWLEQRPGIDSYLVEDQQGPLMFFKTIQLIRAIGKGKYEEVVELHMQFMPRTATEDYDRTRKALHKGYEWLERVLTGNGVAEIYFDSKDLKLIAFCVKYLKFEHRDERVFRRLRKV